MAQDSAPATDPLATELGLDDQRVATVTESVVAWFNSHARDLPWRGDDVSAWGVLVCEVMSQQTPVTRIVPAWTSWMDRWPTPTSLTSATPDEVIRAWDRLGYPRRALRLREAAVVIRDHHGGHVPHRYEDLLTLPGVGDYTASAILAFAFGSRVPVLDTNVRRVLSRLVLGQEHPATASATKLERSIAERMLPVGEQPAADWSAAVMELGALVCRSTSPSCRECPVIRDCSWHAAGQPRLPQGTKRVQKFAGTDRQVRGKLMAVLRHNAESVSIADLRGCWADDRQRDRCLDSLVADGLVEPLAHDRFRLPQ